MEKILFISDVSEDGTLSKVALEVLGGAAVLATSLGTPFSVALFGKNVQAAADSIAGCGAENFLAAAGDSLAVSRYATDAAAMEALVRQSGADLVLAPASKRISRALPGAINRLGGRTDTRVQAVVGEADKVTAERWFYRQRMLGKLSRTQRPWALVSDSGVFEAWTGEAGSATLTTVDSSAESRSEVQGLESPSADAKTIRPNAPLLFVAGAGWTKKQADGELHLQDAREKILGFLGKADASLGSSKSLVDQQTEGEETFTFMSHLNQVGQTGSTPRHPKGLSTCCHGEEPHVVGWRFIGERRAINKDAGCGWAQGKADVVYVADAFEVMEKVNELLG